MTTMADHSIDWDNRVLQTTRRGEGLEIIVGGGLESTIEGNTPRLRRRLKRGWRSHSAWSSANSSTMMPNTSQLSQARKDVASS
jgi:hypothetical protein